MLRTTHSMMDPCPDCGAPLDWVNNLSICDDCGITVVQVEEFGEVEVEESTQDEIGASFRSCPHCRSVGEVWEQEGREWCSGCGLDPNEEFELPDLAHLWLLDSDIRKGMEQGIPRTRQGRMARFLVNYCGPHCKYGDVCPQEKENFIQCFKEVVLDSEDPQLLHIERIPQTDGDDVSKKSRRKARARERERIQKEQGRAILVCARSGWYKKRYSSENTDTKKSTDTGSGSGT